MKKCIFITALVLTGCAERIEYPPALPDQPPPPMKTNGTIYQEDYARFLFNDKVASRVGDVITVRLEETSKGEYRSRTRTDKLAQLDYPLPTFFGSKVPEMEVNTNTKQRFDSRGDSDQSDRLTGNISVTVIKRFSNGNLVIAGENWVTINQGRKYMRLKGIVRQIDIDPNNVISSNKIADAQISYGAGGQAGYGTRGGLLTKLFNAFALY